ncbi:sugar transferase [Neptuniibacter sp. QD29_5]|uniref:sugar transferase n=1 Tax=Neptuniibacter sp. QD29_5 TaxID=3398207 RepID=UPI0039F56559
MIIYRFLDVTISVVALIVFAPVLFVVLILGHFDTGSPVFIQERVGKKLKPFKLIKFRTMHLETESVATHLANASSVTKLGSFLRKTKLDELPQLINVIRGEMSLVGPRPCLFNQTELIKERSEKGVFEVLPGVTGLAQINHIDMSTPKLLSEWDEKMIKTLSVGSYFSYLIKTAIGSGSGDKIR